MPRCEATTTAGEPCRAMALPGATLCVFHEPAARERCAEGRRRGGVSRSRGPATLPADAPPLPLGTIGEVKAALAATVNDVRTGRLGAREGNCLGVLMGVLLRAIEGTDLQLQLDELRRMVEGRQ